MNNITIKQQPVTPPSSNFVKGKNNILPAIRFGQEQDTVTLTSPRHRRAQLYLDFLQTPVTHASEKNEEAISYRSKYCDSFGDKFQYMGQLKRQREQNTPESIKAWLAKRPLASLPVGYEPNFNHRSVKRAPYKLLTVRNLSSLRQGKTVNITIPPTREDNIQVRPPKVNPYMDMTSGSIPSRMVAAGLQPSEIAEEYQAKWSPEKVTGISSKISLIAMDRLWKVCKSKCSVFLHLTAVGQPGPRAGLLTPTQLLLIGLKSMVAANMTLKKPMF